MQLDIMPFLMLFTQFVHTELAIKTEPMTSYISAKYLLLLAIKFNR